MRRKSRVIHIGNVPLGGDYPIRVQSMTNTDTRDVKATVAQSIRMIEAGCEYVRISVPSMQDVEALRQIKTELRNAGFSTPLIADVHFNPRIAEVAATFVEKVRINPGNYMGTQSATHDALEEISIRLNPLLKICKEHGTAIRIGVNHGSLSERIVQKYGHTAEGMVMSAMEFARICDEADFDDLILSLKTSNTRLMIEVNRMLVKHLEAAQLDYPLHLGVTEAGAGEDGRLKSAIGIGSLIADGIGDTIRVSITEDPECEIPVAYAILQATGARITQTEYISCPSCARTLFDIQDAVKKVKAKTSHLTGLRIAIMGCIVNGPGEMGDAHYGYVGAGKGRVNLYKGQELRKQHIPEAEAVDALIELIREGGDWR